MIKNTKSNVITYYFSWLIYLSAFFSWGAFGQISHKLSVLEIDKQVKTLIEPVKGLNIEIRAGLLKIEETCNIIAKNKLEETQKLASSSMDQQMIAMRSEISSAKQITIDQSDAITKFLQETRIKIAPQSKSCDGLIAQIKTSEACNNYKNANEAINRVSDAALYYYAEALARYSSYESAFALEQKGCTRPGFSYRLWNAEQTHLIPTMRTSAQSFRVLLN